MVSRATARLLSDGPSYSCESPRAPRIVFQVVLPFALFPICTLTVLSQKHHPPLYLYICMRTYKNTLITAGAGGTRAACWAAGGSREAAFCGSA